MQKELFKFRSILIIIGIILFIASLLLIYTGINGINYDFTNSIFVITKDEDTNNINYYEINDKERCRNKEMFEPDKMEEFTVNNCYKSYISGNKVLNRLTLDTCIIEDNKGNDIEITEEFRKIVEKVSDLEDDIFKNKILRINNEYYVVVEFNVNLWSPYGLYYYDRGNDELKHLYTFKGKDIIGLKTK
jgi:ABC-type lipoprotein release transport system permease subunit